MSVPRPCCRGSLGANPESSITHSTTSLSRVRLLPRLRALFLLHPTNHRSHAGTEVQPPVWARMELRFLSWGLSGGENYQQHKQICLSGLIRAQWRVAVCRPEWSADLLTYHAFKTSRGPPPTSPSPLLTQRALRGPRLLPDLITVSHSCMSPPP